MKLHEVAQINLPGFICVPRGSIWQKEIKGVWVFDTIKEAEAASKTEAATKQLISSADNSYMVPIETLNDIALLMHVTDKGFHEMHGFSGWHPSGPQVFHVYAYGVSEAGVRKAAEKVAESLGHSVNDWGKANSLLWCYKTYNNDPSIFREEDE